MGCLGCFSASKAHSSSRKVDTVICDADAAPGAAVDVNPEPEPEDSAVLPSVAHRTSQPHQSPFQDGQAPGARPAAGDNCSSDEVVHIGGHGDGGTAHTVEPASAAMVTPVTGDAKGATDLPSQGQVLTVPGIESLPVLASNSKVQNWLSSSLSDYDPGQSSSAADCTIESVSHANSAGTPQTEPQQGPPVARRVASLQPDGDLSVAAPTATEQAPLPGQTEPTPGTSVSESDEQSASQRRQMRACGRSAAPGVPQIRTASTAAYDACTHAPGAFAPLPVHSRLSSHRTTSSSTSAPINTATGIDGVLSLLRNRSHITVDTNHFDHTHDGVMEDVSAVVASLHTPAAATPTAGSIGASQSPVDAKSEADLKEEPVSMLSGGHRLHHMPPTHGRMAAMPDMHRQIADMFLTEEDHPGGASQPAAGVSWNDLPGEWSPPSLAANELDATSCSSTTSLITPLRVHADTATQPYIGAPHPTSEVDRMDHLCSLAVLGTTPERRFDRLTALAATVFSVPIVLVSLVDRHRQWFKSVMGLPGVTETDRQSSFCAWTLLPQCPECLVVSDARNDARFRNNKLVTGPPHIQFYAGCPLVSSNGMRLGSLCIIDARTRYFTTEDCNLLSNFAELAVREVEAKRADERLAFEAQPDEFLRSRVAWDVGLLSLHIVNESWVVRHANDRAGRVLGVADVDTVIGTDFWEHVTLRDDSLRPSQRFQRQLLEAADFSADVKAFTEEGRKVWLSCSFTSGTLSQVDDECPVVSVPMDLTSEPGTKAAYWFVTVQPLAGTPRAVAGLGGLVQSRRSRESQRGDTPLACSELLDHFDAESLQDITASAQISETVRSQLLHMLRAPENGDATDGRGEHLLAEMVSTHEPAALRAALEGTQRQWQQHGLPEHAVLDVLRVVEGRDMLLVLRHLPMPICMSMRTAMHEGVFKHVPTPQQLHEGVVAVDTRLVLGTLLHVARAVERLHAAGAVHGGICDTSLVVTTAAPKAAQWRHGRDVQVSFGSLGAVAEPVHRSDLTAVRADMALFYAPERFNSHGMLAAPSAAGDIWAVGMLLVYCMRLSLPLVRDGFLALRAMAQEGSLLRNVLQLEEQPMPVQLRMLITLCLHADPAARPTAARLAAALQHISEVESGGAQHGKQ